MRICYLNYEWDLAASTGAATQIRETAGGLERLGHEVVVIDGHRKPPSRPGQARRPLSRWLWEPANLARSLRDVPREIALLRPLQPDVVLILHALRFSGLLAARRLALPVVFQVNASVPCEIRRYRPEFRLRPAFSEWLEGRMLAASDGVIAVSRVLARQLASLGVPPGLISVVPNGVDPGRFHPGAAGAEFRCGPAGSTLAGFAGSFAGFHGLDLLERAVVAAAAQAPRLHFVFAGPGSGPFEARLRARGCEHRATFLGRLPHDRMPAFLAAMDILLAPYAPESDFYFSPLKLYEYMACGRAVLSTRPGQIAEVIEDSHNGALHDADAPEEFVGKLLKLAADPPWRESLGAAARRTILSGHTWTVNARRVSEILEKAVCSEGRPRAPAAVAAASS